MPKQEGLYVCPVTPNGVKAGAAPHRAQCPLLGLLVTWEEKEHEAGCENNSSLLALPLTFYYGLKNVQELI